MGLLTLPGLGGKVRYAQILNDASEIPFRDASNPRDLGYMGFFPGDRKDADGGEVTFRLPVVKPVVEVPVLEIILK
jgi:alpha-L-fucosidase